MSVKLKDLKDAQGKNLLPEKKIHTHDSISCYVGEEQNGCVLCKRNKDIEVLGELDLTEAFERYARENGWVKIATLENGDGGNYIRIKDIRKLGYIKLNEIRFDVEKITELLEVDEFRPARTIAQAIAKEPKGLIREKDG